MSMRDGASARQGGLGSEHSPTAPTDVRVNIAGFALPQGPAYVSKSGYPRDSQFDMPGRAVTRPQSGVAEARAMDAQREFARHSIAVTGSAAKMVRTLSFCRALSHRVLPKFRRSLALF
jgi:hypothetical protein